MTITAGDGSQLPQVSQPLSEILEGFLRAQRLDLYPPQELAPGIVALQADDDESLVNSYVTYDPPPGSRRRTWRAWCAWPASIRTGRTS